ncbi:MAG TPA: phosphoribosyl-ATP diphosphatase [Ruminiclostridium sp.]|jgi:phosphoribosyl-ATP pyrophosphohydrolase|nr:phosphoribosyl-ATP diphosphatase [Ruminiclostridium sp.]
MNDLINELYEIVMSRKSQHIENSYTCYLFEKGIDKILKKVGEETSEVIIAAKNGKNEDTVNEMGDLLYHLLVLMAEQGIKPEDLNAVLEERRKKSGNLKVQHKVDKNS